MQNTTPTISPEDRLDQVEMALMLFMALLTGVPDATEEEQTGAQVELAGLMKAIAARHRIGSASGV